MPRGTTQALGDSLPACAPLRRGRLSTVHGPRSEAGGDGAFGRRSGNASRGRSQSGVALRLPPHSKRFATSTPRPNLAKPLECVPMMHRDALGRVWAFARLGRPRWEWLQAGGEPQMHAKGSDAELHDGAVSKWSSSVIIGQGEGCFCLMAAWGRIFFIFFRDFPGFSALFRSQGHFTG